MATAGRRPFAPLVLLLSGVALDILGRMFIHVEKLLHALWVIYHKALLLKCL